MANLGETTELVNSTECTLEVGSDIYVALTDLEWVVSRPEDRSPTTDLGPIYTYGKGDNFFTATLNITSPEISSLNTLTATDANGNLTATSWKIVYKDSAGATKTAAATGVLRDFKIRKEEEGIVKIDIFVRITGDTVTVS